MRGAQQVEKTVADLEVRNWSWRYSSRQAWAIQNLSLTIPFGQKVGIVGPTGAGKSTLLHALAGVLDVDEGEQVGGVFNGDLPADSPNVRGTVGLVQQNPQDQVVMAEVGDEVAFGLENWGVEGKEIWGRVRTSLDSVGLQLPFSHSTGNLSGGQKQRLALACAFAVAPPVVLLDEPTANLDPQGAFQLREATIAGVDSSGATLVVVDHHIGPWLEMLDRLLVMDANGIVADGSPDQVLAERREELLAAGVWVPEAPLPAPVLPSPIDAQPVVAAELADLQVGFTGDERVAGPFNSQIFGNSSTVVVGPNGAGKTALALTMAGLLPPVGGQVQLAPELVGHVRMVFQEPQYQFLTNTVRGELAYGLQKMGLEQQQVTRRVETYLQRLNLTELGEAHPLTLSGGEQRRLAIGTALIVEPQLLIVDEPTFGQDYNSWLALVELLSTVVTQGNTLVSVSHDPDYLQVMGQQTLQVAAQQRAENHSGKKPAKQGLVDRLNPLTVILMLLLLTTPLLMTIDPVSAGTALLLELIALPALRLGWKRTLLRISPVLVAAPLAGMSMLLYGQPSGHQFFSWGPLQVTTNSVTLALSLVLRVLAIGIPGVLLLSSINPTHLADALTQKLHLPTKVVYSALAGLRTVSSATEDWQALQRARISRGAPKKGIVHGFFALLGFALRRADTLSVTMAARGLGGTGPRTYARISTFTTTDVWAVLVAVLIPSIALTAAILTGTFKWFGLA